MNVHDWIPTFSMLLRIATSNESAELMGCKVEKFHIVYLGLPLGAKVMDQKICQGVLDGCAKKLAPGKNCIYPLLGGSH